MTLSERTSAVLICYTLLYHKAYKRFAPVYTNMNVRNEYTHFVSYFRVEKISWTEIDIRNEVKGIGYYQAFVNEIKRPYDFEIEHLERNNRLRFEYDETQNVFYVTSPADYYIKYKIKLDGSDTVRYEPQGGSEKDQLYRIY